MNDGAKFWVRFPRMFADWMAIALPMFFVLGTVAAIAVALIWR